jgi:hypothetical protein
MLAIVRAARSLLRRRDPARTGYGDAVAVFLGLGALLVTGCASPQGGWDYSALPGGPGGSPLVRASRLSDSPPYFAPDQEGLVLFLCRWSTRDPIPVSLPAGASAAELRIVREALAAWSEAGLGVAFREVAPAKARMDIRFVPRVSGSPPDSANALADCAVESSLGEHGTLRAELRWASIHLYRDNRDALGRDVPLDQGQLFGAVLHELGHALGFASHPVLGQSIMQRTTEGVEAIAGRVRGGEELEAPNLRALYALPSGVIVGRLALSPEQMEPVRRLAAAARRLGWKGPYSRVGGGRARYFYRDPAGGAAALSVRAWKRGIERPSEIVFEPNARARELFRSAAPR